MVPTFADFSISPPRLHNMTLVQNDSEFWKDHAILGNSGRVTVMFNVQEDDLGKTVVTIVGLASRLEPHQGYSPITLHVNSHIFIPSYTLPGDGSIPQSCPFHIPPELLTPGENSLTLQVDSHALSYFWLYRLTIDTNTSIGKSEHERLSMLANEAVFTYDTEYAGSNMAQWQQAGNLMLFIDSGEAALPAQLSWSDQERNSVSISFQSSMCDFYGYYQPVNEGPTSYRGRLLTREQSPKNSVGISTSSLSMQAMSLPKIQEIFTYRTEHAWGDMTQWHEAANLRFFIHSGEAVLPVRLIWRDQKGNSASVSFQPGMSSFCGYYQRVNEGPIAYRGKLTGRPLSKLFKESMAQIGNVQS